MKYCVSLSITRIWEAEVEVEGDTEDEAIQAARMEYDEPYDRGDDMVRVDSVELVDDESDAAEPAMMPEDQRLRRLGAATLPGLA